MNSNNTNFFTESNYQLLDSTTIDNFTKEYKNINVENTQNTILIDKSTNTMNNNNSLLNINNYLEMLTYIKKLQNELYYLKKSQCTREGF